MTRTVVDPAFPQRLRELREQRGLSLRRLGASANYSHALIGYLEHGTKTPTAETARLLDAALDAGGTLAALVTVTDTIEPDSGPLDRVERLRRRVTGSISSSLMSEASIDDWERTAADYGRATRYRPAGLLLDDLIADFEDLAAQLDRRHPSSVQRRITRVAAQMAGLVFLTLCKLDERREARAWARTAYLAADEAGDPALRSWVRAQEAYVHYYAGDLREAITVAGYAQTIAGSSACVGVALAAALQARALAMVGDDNGTRAAVEAAQRALAALDADSVLASAFGYNQAQLSFHTGNALTHLGDTTAAWTAQQEALALYDQTDYLDRALVHLDRVECLVRDGEVTEAVAYGVTELSGLTFDQRAGLINVRAAEIIAALPSGRLALPAAAELVDMFVS